MYIIMKNPANVLSAKRALIFILLFLSLYLFSCSGKKHQYAVIETARGEIHCRLRPDAAPEHVKNFIRLAQKGFYRNLTFHRVEDWVIQGGDPEGNGMGGPGYTLPAEIQLSHSIGALAAARTGDSMNPERRSSGSQFYITKSEAKHLDGQYTVFGYCKNQDVINTIAADDLIKKIRIESR